MHSTRNQTLAPEEARMWARVGVLGAFALILSYVETFIPIPVPIAGVKLGLANIVVLLALYLLDFKSACAIAGVKVLASGFLFGSPIMIAYSAAGTVLALLSMFPLVRIRKISPILIAIIGAIFHNVGQLLVASLLLGTPLVFLTAPLLFAAACITGGITGALGVYLLGQFEMEAA